ncbi:hypothetical protein ACS0TY_006171 [Phlomoides rotata]
MDWRNRGGVCMRRLGGGEKRPSLWWAVERGRAVAEGSDTVVFNTVKCGHLFVQWGSFGRLCFLMRELEGLIDHKYVSVEEQVSMFLSILAHHKKNRVIKFNFQGSGQIVSHYVHLLLKAVLGLHTLFLVQPTHCCLEALDETYINLHVLTCDKPRFRIRKGHISTNVLGEGSTAEYRVLCDAVIRPHTLKVLKARNDIECAFSVLKMRFRILRSAAYSLVKNQVRLIMACVLLHKFIRSMTLVDPYEVMLDDASHDEDEQW